MFETLHRDRVTVFVPVTRDVTNDEVYEQVLDKTDGDGKGGGPSILNCFIERRRRRITTESREEIQTDATMVFRVVDRPTVEMENIVFDSKKDKAYKVVGLEGSEALYGGGEFVRADLINTVLPVPAEKEDGRPDEGRPI